MKKILIPLGLSALIVLFLAVAVLWKPASQPAPKSDNGNVTEPLAPVASDTGDSTPASETPSIGTGSQENTSSGSDSWTWITEGTSSGVALAASSEAGSGASDAGVSADSNSGSTESGSTAETFDENAFCTDEYAPVCGSDGNTYPNACAANRMKVSYVPGSCGKMPEWTALPEISNPGSESGNAGISTDRALSDTGSLTYWNEGIGYGFSLPRGAYFAGFGARDGAIHSVGVGKDAPETFEGAAVRIRLFKGKVLPQATDSRGFATGSDGIAYFAVNGSTISVEGSENFPGILESIAKSAYVR